MLVRVVNQQLNHLSERRENADIISSWYLLFAVYLSSHVSNFLRSTFIAISLFCLYLRIIDCSALSEMYTYFVFTIAHTCIVYGMDFMLILLCCTIWCVNS
jgi:hypothetical protein